MTDWQITLNGNTSAGKLTQLNDYLLQLSVEIVCLLSTRDQWEETNNKILNTIPINVIKIIVIDNIESNGKYQKKRVLQTLEKYEDDNSRTACLNKSFFCKKKKNKEKVISRRNIDIINKLVNSIIGAIKKIIKDPNNVMKFNWIQLITSIHKLERITSKC